jgi:tetratricopeptide (TPR) repeat protein
MANHTGDIFLARTEEQKRFREILHELIGSRLARSLPTFTRLAKRFRSKPKPEPTEPFICLFYGEGGMGKTTLSRHLDETIVQQESPFKGRIASVRLDWEAERDRVTGLQVGHDRIEPETILTTLCGKLKDETEVRWFGEYDKTHKAIREAEKQIDAALKKQDPVNPELSKKLIDGGSRAIAAIVQQHLPIADAKQTQPHIAMGIEVTAELASQVRSFVAKALKPDQVELYEQPSQKLAKALGVGIAKLAARQPLVIFLDTYEIVDRPECDAIVRVVMREAGARVVWVVTGRANLADSGQRGDRYVRGYSSEFKDDRLYAKSLAGFGRETILEFFRRAVPEKPLTEDQAEQVDRFSLGIPFVVNEVAAMWRQGVAFETIVAPVEKAIGEDAHLKVIAKASERFLMHCLSDEADLAAVYALAMMRRPSSELFAAMVDSADVVARVQTLRSRYSFILESGGLRLSEKLAGFVREYLRGNELRRNQYRALNERAVMWLELQLEQKSRGIVDTADLFEEEAIAQLRADWIHHQFWLGEDEGWQWGLTWFVLGWEYSRRWLEAEFAELEGFVGGWSPDGRRRLRVFQAGLRSFSAELEAVEALIVMLEKLAGRGWLAEALAIECGAIVQLARGDWLNRQEKYLEALALLFEVDRLVPEGAKRLRRNLASSLGSVGWKLAVVKEQTIASADAERAFRRAIDLQAKKVSYWCGLGIVHEGFNRYEEAIASYRKAIELDPNFAYTYKNLGNAQSDLGQKEEAIASYRKAIEIDPNDAIAYYNLGIAQKSLGQTEEAIASYRKAIEIDPNLAAAYNGLGVAQSALGQKEEAIASYRKAIELDPNLAAAYNNLGSAQKSLGQKEEAIASYRKAIEIDPNFASAYNNLGSAQKSLGQKEEAIASYRKAIEIDPNLAAAYYNLGNAQKSLGQKEEAIASYRKAIELDPNYAAAYYNLGLAQSDLGQTEEAIASYRKAIELDPNYAYAYNGLGIVQSALGQTEEAIASYRKAIEIDPNDAIAYYNLGNAQKSLGQTEEAIASYRKAIEIDPNLPQPRNNLSEILDELGYKHKQAGNVEQAIELYQKAIELGGENHNNLGWAYVLIGDLENAKTQFNIALAADPDALAETCNLGIVYALENDLEQAKQLLSKGIEQLQDDDSFDRLFRSIFQLVLGQTETALDTLRNTPLDRDNLTYDTLFDAHGVAEVLTRCPTEIPGLPDAIALLKTALDQHQTQPPEAP